MKLIFLFLIISLIQVAASTKAQTITLNKQNVSITAVFEAIMIQSDYDFSYSEQQISKVGRINISVTNASITEVLDECFQGQALTYTISNNTITIKDIPQPFFKRILKRFSAVVISGTVVDEQGNALPGATVKLQGSKTKTSTDDKGFFSLNSDEETGVINISYLGYISEQISFSANNVGPFRVVLKQISSGLEEVEINAGYYTVKERELTGSISKITSETIGKQPVSNPLQALQGRIAGVEIIQTNGLAGGGFNVRIRGQNSIANGNDPLYIVDGIQYPSSTLSSTLLNSGILYEASPLSSINPSDIESIEVLKDADATAIYGSRGANGVILITTKKGKPGELKIELNSYYGSGKVSRKLPLLNTEQYIEMRKEAFANDKATPGTTAYDLNGAWDQTRYTDWQKELIGGSANLSNTQLSLSGGKINTSFRLGGAYNRETTVFPGDKRYQKKSGLLNINHTTTDQKIKIQVSATYNLEDSTLPTTDLTSSIRMAPNAPALISSTGSLNWENGTFTNPLNFLYKDYSAKIGTLTANSTISYLLLSKLELSARIGYSKMIRDEIHTVPITSVNPSFGLTANSRVSNFADNWNQTVNFEPQISWNSKIGSGKLNLLIGTTVQQTNLHKQIVQGTGFISDGLLKNIAAAATLRVRDALNTEYRYLSVYGRINYNLADRYFINLTGRRDGSSRFGRDNIYANFGAVGAGWIFSQEGYVADQLSFLSFGKIRASYGLTGNDQIGDYNYLELWGPTTNPYQGMAGLFPTRIPNSNYAWETNRKIEAALELGFLKDKINLTVAHYRNRSSNQLVNYGLPPSTGFISIQTNLPATVQNTGFEFELATTNIHKKDFKWLSSLNFNAPKSKLIAFPGLEQSLYYQSSYVVGESLNILKTLNFIGVDSETGLYKYEDINGDGQITFAGDAKIIKTLGQRFSGGFHNIVTFKNWELDFLFQFVDQLGRNYRTNSIAPGGLSNQLDLVRNRWRNKGDAATIQRYTVSTGNALYNLGKSYGLAISDASFIRLKNVALSYSLPENKLKHIGVKNARIYMQAQNLFTITNYLGLDPENQNLLVLPPLRMITAGLQVSL